MKFLWYNIYIENDKNEVYFMTAAKPKNMKEALEIIEMLQSKNDELQSRNDSLELLVHNMNEMLTKGRRMMFGRSSEQLRYVEGCE